MARAVENELTHGVAPDGSRRYVLACNEGTIALNNIRQQFVASNQASHELKLLCKSYLNAEKVISFMLIALKRLVLWIHIKIGKSSRVVSDPKYKEGYRWRRVL